MAYQKYKKAFTLVELLVSIFLLGMVVATAVTLELALRRMQVKPSVQVKLLDELIPVLERIKKDFQMQIGSQINASLSIEDSGRRILIRVDDGDGILDSGDPWHTYRWDNAPGHPVEYSPNNSTFTEIASGITYFNVASAYNNTAITIQLRTRKDPLSPEDLFDNPSVNLTTTIFSRLTSGR